MANKFEALFRLRDALPDRAKLQIGKTPKGSYYFEIFVTSPSLYQKGTLEEEASLQEVLNWQRDIIGEENIAEFDTLETGKHWFIYLR